MRHKTVNTCFDLGISCQKKYCFTKNQNTKRKKKQWKKKSLITCPAVLFCFRDARSFDLLLFFASFRFFPPSFNYDCSLIIIIHILFRRQTGVELRAFSRISIHTTRLELILWNFIFSYQYENFIEKRRKAKKKKIYIQIYFC